MLDPDFAREQYRFELQRKTELLNAVSLPVGILSGLGSLLVVIAKGYSYSSLPRVPFVLFLSLGALCFGVAAFALARAYLSEQYAFIPKPRAIESLRNGLEEFYTGLGYPPERADPDFREQLTRWYVDATDRNSRYNDRRTRYLDRAAQGLVGVLISTAICGILYLVDALRTL